MSLPASPTFFAVVPGHAEDKKMVRRAEVSMDSTTECGFYSKANVSAPSLTPIVTVAPSRTSPAIKALASFVSTFRTR